ncbi:hypothetical protein HYH03_000541 [Edaphochlamys debaryana]|uniref:Ribonuclease H n=1 Tax=Edaphochlamys debaryana TaxID=47281 RepID=A0A836C7R6_9CHLO|nr:hypothetical protein HYH03_000541 [Edaphochlamys debaryana]|eukprot:KAG2502047.1 hypothetical protein HYH03_000541 [Edaphochlamys debaryana]
MSGKYYAVRVGRRPGIYTSWEQVKPLVDGFLGAKHKSFKSRMAAEEFLQLGDGPSGGGPMPVLPTMVVQPGPAGCRGRGGYDDGGYDDHGYGGSRSRSRSRSRSPPAPVQRVNPYLPQGMPSMQPAPRAAYRPAPPAPAPAAARHMSTARGGRFDPVVEGPQEQIYSSVRYQLEFDGASRGNPGLGGCGAVLRRQDTSSVVCTLRKFMGGQSTNNEAEYTALIEGLKMARRLGVTRLLAQGDSKLVVQQVLGNWRVNKEHLQPLREAAVAESLGFAEFSIQHVRREWNAAADKLSNDAIDLAYR